MQFLSVWVGCSQISFSSFRFLGIMKTKLGKFLVNRFKCWKNTLRYCLFLPDNMKWLTSNFTKPNRNNVFSIHMEFLWICEANIAKTKPHQQQIISQFPLLIFYKLQSFFKMSHNNLFKTYFSLEKYWFLGWKISNLKRSFLSKNPV